MRLTGGTGKGRRLVAPPSRVRPTSARTREVLFQHLSGKLSNAAVLDLFAGSGLLGLEALARGASSAVFVERDYTVARIIKRNIELCGFDGESRVVRMDVLSFLPRAPDRFPAGFDLVFADPPYDSVSLETLCAGIARPGLLRTDGLFVFEDSSRKVATVPETWDVEFEREIGDTRLLVLARRTE